ncbi:carbohydrate porin [Agarivorans sp. MS3-6]
MNRHNICLSYGSLILLSAFSLSSVASSNFGSPSSVDNTLSDDLHTGITEARQQLQDNHGITMAVDYQALGIKASDTFPSTDSTAASGVARFYGSWDAYQRGAINQGSLVWKIEHRHKYTNTAPKDMGLGNIGMAGMIGPAYSDQGLRLTNLFWKQKFNDGNTSLIVGFLDTTDYLDTYALASPWTGFTNLAFSTGGAAIGLPDDGTLGLALGHLFSSQFYSIVGITDANADSGKPFKGFENFVNKHQYFTSLELGWTSSQQRIYLDNVHVTAWHLDGGTRHSVNNSKGLNFSASYMLDKGFMPFLRGGYSKGDASLVSKSITLGLGHFGLAGEKNSLGFAVNWAEPNDELFGSGLSKQMTSELYYHYTLNPYIALTPDIQYIKNPALNQAVSSTWVLGLRVRVLY